MPWLWALGALVSSIAVAVAVRAKTRRTGLWASGAVLGQVAMLEVIKAGPLIGYQHFMTLAEAWAQRPVALVTALVVLVAAIAGIAANARSVWAQGRAHPARWILIAALATGVLLGAAPSASATAYAAELALAATLQLSVTACVALAAVTLPEANALAMERWIAAPPGPAVGPVRLDALAWGAAAFVTGIASILCLTSYQAIPHIPDEIAYVLQARYLAMGDLWMAPPPVPAGFDTFLLEVSGDRWYGVFPPGWPLVLAVGVKLGVPWLVNPLLGGACVLLASLLLQELADRRTAHLSVLLMAASPWHLMMSMTFMSHVLSLTLALVTALGAARAWRTGSWRPALAGGLALGVLGMSRPLEGVAVGLITGLPLLVAAVRRGQVAALVGGAFGTALTGIPGLAYNRLLTGNALVFPAERLFDREFGPGRYSIGFGPEKGLGWTGLDPFPGHGPADVAVNAVLNGFMMNVDLFGWAAGSIAIVALGALIARRGVERLMLITIATVIGLHSAFWFSGGPDVGARYWYLILIPCVVLAVRALGFLGRARPLAGAALLSLAALVLYVPWRAADKYRYYRGIRADLVTMRDDPRYRGGLILVSGRRHPEWAAAAIANEIPIGATARPVFAWDRDAATRAAVLEAFPTRPVWLVRGPVDTGGGFEVILGPIAPAGRAELHLP